MTHMHTVVLNKLYTSVMQN